MEQKNSPFKLALTYGLYLGLINIAISLIIWATSLIETLGLMGSMVIGITNLVILGFLLVYFTKLYRNNMLEGKITFGQAFTFGIMLVVCSSIISGLYSFVFNKFVDPEYTQRIMTAMQEKMYQMFTNQGMSEDQIEAAMRKFEEQATPTPLKTLTSALTTGLIGGAIMSLISSAIVKKNINKDDAFEEAMEEVKPEE